MKKIKTLSLLLLTFLLISCGGSDTDVQVDYPDNLIGTKWYWQEFVPKEQSNLDGDSTVEWYYTFVDNTTVENETTWIFGKEIISKTTSNMTYTYSDGFVDIQHSVDELWSFKFQDGDLILYKIYSSDTGNTTEYNLVVKRIN